MDEIGIMQKINQIIIDDIFYMTTEQEQEYWEALDMLTIRRCD